MPVEKSAFTFTSSDGKTEVFASSWQTAGENPRVVLQISHGMVEYMDRYDDFARFICGQGGAVYGNDHLGHGRTGENAGLLGCFAENDGAAHVVDDLCKLTTLIKEKHPGVPVFLLGHSMGSFIARVYATKYAAGLSGVIFMGTAGKNPFTGLLRALARLGCLFGGAKKPANFISKLAFGAHTAKIPDAASKNDWLSRDKDIVAAYDADPWCTYRFTNRAFYDLSKLLSAIEGPAWAEKLDKEAPYLLVSGEMDPVGGYGAGVREVYGLMQNAGVKQVEMKLYPGARHEVLNETNRQEVYGDLLNWITGHL
ncbi:MAG TPA: alpha/beta hydrolase [Clostridiales bacterium]|nr:alpha/beta hydrolase [Clostridiales bacterium]